MKKIFLDKRYIGIFLALILGVLFVGISLIVLNYLSGTPWYLFSSILRLLFGAGILFIVNKVYGKTVKQVLGFHNNKVALVSGIGFIVYFLYYVFVFAAGYEAIVNLPIGILITKIILQQITTGFYEELNYRLLILEGYSYGKRTIGRKIGYAFVSFVIFGLLHVVTGWDTYAFLQTGIIGFAFAVIYLNSGNIIIPMLLHFIYDIFANLAGGYIEWNNSSLFISVNSIFEIVLVVMFILSFALLFKKEIER